jgi:hypothetical protein
MAFCQRSSHTTGMGNMEEILGTIWIVAPSTPSLSRQLVSPKPQDMAMVAQQATGCYLPPVIPLLHVYSLLMMNRTHLGNLYFLIGETSTIPIHVTPISVQHVDADVVSLQGVGRTARHQPHCAGTFWETLPSYEGGWMWDYVHVKMKDTGSIATALEEGTVILSTDGSYLSTKAPDLCSAGWNIACRKGQGLIKGSFYKYSPNAGSYRGSSWG